MKVKEFAERQGVTIQAVYQRLKGLKGKTGQPLSYYIEPNTKELTGEGLNILTQLYSESKQIKDIPTKTLEDKLNTLKATVESLENKCKALQTEVESKDREIKRLEDQVTDLRNDKQFLQTLADNLSKKPKQSFFKRLLSGKKEE